MSCWKRKVLNSCGKNSWVIFFWPTEKREERREPGDKSHLRKRRPTDSHISSPFPSFLSPLCLHIWISKLCLLYGSPWVYSKWVFFFFLGRGGGEEAKDVPTSLPQLFYMFSHKQTHKKKSFRGGGHLSCRRSKVFFACVPNILTFPIFSPFWRHIKSPSPLASSLLVLPLLWWRVRTREKGGKRIILPGAK